jgi:hypothetical protein
MHFHRITEKVHSQNVGLGLYCSICICLLLSYAYRWNQEMMVYLNMLAPRRRALSFCIKSTGLLCSICQCLPKMAASSFHGNPPADGFTDHYQIIIIFCTNRFRLLESLPSLQTITCTGVELKHSFAPKYLYVLVILAGIDRDTGNVRMNAQL